ncbi:MAG: hypothetical protein VB099_06955 [Candidatus Limiplasma sp.]|nr:hypothetical protein [Candidatus Limiplasma sp.]
MNDQNRNQLETAYRARLDGIEFRLAQLTTKLEEVDKIPMDEVNWGHVGSLGYVDSLLTEVLAFWNDYDSSEAN